MSRYSKTMLKILLAGIIAILCLLLASDYQKQDELSRSDSEGKTKEVGNVTTVFNVKDVVLPEMVNVVLTNDNWQEPYRSAFQIKTTSSVTLTSGEMTQTYGSETVFSKEMLAGLFTQSNVVIISPSNNQSLFLLEADTEQWSAPYRGIFMIYKNGDKYWIVNQVPLEEYLLGVVPGEMPERFSLEALKAQAICARTYVCNMIKGDAYAEYNADVDDSVNCQVYNKHGENSKATEAVTNTAGIVLLEQGNTGADFASLKMADIYYFSTSCGYTTGLEAWGEESLPYLKTVSTLLTPKEVTDWDQYLKSTDVQAYDSGSNYFRWKAQITVPEGYTLQINKREASGIVTQITMLAPEDKQVATTEHEVRSFLGQYMTSLVDSQGAAIPMDILPSAWIALEQGNASNQYVIYGGGYGHGIGMSQYGAHGMAEQGMNCEQILLYYFPGTLLT